MPDNRRVALITGGSRGLGRSTVSALAARGVDSIFTYNTDTDAADEVVATVEHAGARAVSLRLDTCGTVRSRRSLARSSVLSATGARTTLTSS